MMVDEDSCILCRLCMIACPVGMMVVDTEKKTMQKCTLCMDSDCIIPACVEACRDNVLKVFSIEELEELRNEADYADILSEVMKDYQNKR